MTMNRSHAPAIALALAASLAGLAAHGADDPKERQDLTAVIALNGQPCGEVVSYVVNGDNDYVATCKDGHRYHVYVKDGRVVVEKQ
jgi:hypothetical protein